jgi:hypothetical protein
MERYYSTTIKEDTTFFAPPQWQFYESCTCIFCQVIPGNSTRFSTKKPFISSQDKGLHRYPELWATP